MIFSSLWEFFVELPRPALGWFTPRISWSASTWIGLLALDRAPGPSWGSWPAVSPVFFGSSQPLPQLRRLCPPRPPPPREGLWPLLASPARPRSSGLPASSSAPTPAPPPSCPPSPPSRPPSPISAPPWRPPAPSTAAPAPDAAAGGPATTDPAPAGARAAWCGGWPLARGWLCARRSAADAADGAPAGPPWVRICAS